MDEHIQTSQHMLDTLSSDHARLMARTRMPRFYAVGIGILSALLLAIMLGSAALCLLLGFRLASFLWIPPVAIIAGALTAVVQQAGITLSERQTVMEDPS